MEFLHIIYIKKYLAYLKDEGFEINDELYTIFRLKTKGLEKKIYI